MGAILSSDFQPLYSLEPVAQIPKHSDKIDYEKLRQIKFYSDQPIGEDFSAISGNLKDHETKIGLYFGEMINGKRNGPGIQKYHDNRDVLMNVFADDQPNGKGFLLKENDDYFYGTWNKGKIQGVGVLRTKLGKEKLLGQWLDNKLHGIAMVHTERFTYRGQYKQGFREGVGVCDYLDGSSYCGNWNKDTYEGFGVFTYSNGAKYQGTFVNGLKQGLGVETLFNGETYKGEFMNDRRHGIGIVTLDRVTKQARWENNKIRGLCKVTENNNVRWQYHTEGNVEDSSVQEDRALSTLLELQHQVENPIRQSDVDDLERKMREVHLACQPSYGDFEIAAQKHVISLQSLVDYDHEQALLLLQHNNPESNHAMGGSKAYITRA